MNEDLILRARVHELGEDVLEKKIGSFKRGTTGPSKFMPGIGQWYEKNVQGGGLTMSDSQYKQQVADLNTQRAQSNTQNRRTKLANRGLNTRNVSNISPTGKDAARLKEAEEDTQKLTEAVQSNPVMNQQQMGDQSQQPATQPRMPDTSQQFGGGQGNVTDPNQQPQQDPSQQQPMNPTINPQVQGMAQQYQMGQDINTLEQGKKGKETWLRNPDGSMKSGGQLGMSVLTGMATGGISNLIGAGMRKLKNRGVDQQNQKFNQAQTRMNMRAMGSNPTMTKSLSTQHEISAIRRGIRERNTTYNLRR
jgi:hypothetical protein